MKGTFSIKRAVLAAAVVLSLSYASAPADAANEKEIALVSADSGYKIIVPGFIDIRTLKADGADIRVVAMEAPPRNDEGRYPLFQIASTDKNAYSVESFPGVLDEGRTGAFEGRFSEGRLLYAPAFSSGKDLEDFPKDTVFSFDFYVLDQKGKVIFSAINLNFVFTDDTVQAKPASSKVTVNGKAVAFEAYSIGGSNYFRLRDLAMALNGTEKQFQVGWDDERKTIALTSKTAYTPIGNELTVSGGKAVKAAKPCEAKVFLDGSEIRLTVYNIGGSNYFKLRDMGMIFDFGVTWDEKLNTIGLDTSAGYREKP